MNLKNSLDPYQSHLMEDHYKQLLFLSHFVSTILDPRKNGISNVFYVVFTYVLTAFSKIYTLQNVFFSPSLNVLQK